MATATWLSEDEAPAPPKYVAPVVAAPPKYEAPVAPVAPAIPALPKYDDHHDEKKYEAPVDTTTPTTPAPVAPDTGYQAQASASETQNELVSLYHRFVNTPGQDNLGQMVLNALARTESRLCPATRAFLHGILSSHDNPGMIASAAETIVLASSEKLKAASKYVIAPISQISGLITEKSVPSSVIAQFAKVGLSITQV